MSLKRKSTLDQITEILKPAPEIGSDDDLDFDTKAKVIEDFEDEYSDDNGPQRSILKQSAALDDDPRYFGKKISRRDANVAEDSGNESSEAPLVDPVPSNDTSDFERDFMLSRAEVNSDSEEESYEEQDGDKDSEEYNSDDGDSSEYNDEYSITNAENSVETQEEYPVPDKDTFQHISSVKDVASEVEKGKAVKSQINIWDSLLECRIQLQKCLIPANRLPKYNKMGDFMVEGGSEFAAEMKKTTHSVRKLLDKFRELQGTLIDNYSETKNLTQKVKSKESDSEEEILSDNEQEEDDTKNSISTNFQPPKKKKKLNLEDYEDQLSTDHKQYLEFRDAIIQKWNDRTRIITGKMSNRDFSAFEQSTLQQIRHVLNNRTRLVQRTQTPRTVSRILGELEVNDISSLPELDAEIFDDSDFYHQLLRELIERRSDDNQDSTVLGRRWAALQKLRTKMKRRVDTRATKGRKLRYDPHQKLVGFMAPIESSNTWNDKAITDIFNSLFGKHV